jgi:hypothetical protein
MLIINLPEGPSDLVQNFIPWINLVFQGLLLIGAYIAYVQLGYAKEDIELTKKESFRRQRAETVQNTVIQLEKFKETLAVYIQLSNKIDKKLELAHSNLKSRRLKNFSQEEIPRGSTELQRDYALGVKFYLENAGDNEISKDLASISNSLEIIAIAFTSAETDKDIALPVIAKGFCTIVEQLYFFYCVNRKESYKLNFYSHTICLYQEWSSKLDEVEGLPIGEKTQDESGNIITVWSRPRG